MSLETESFTFDTRVLIKEEPFENEEEVHLEKESEHIRETASLVKEENEWIGSHECTNGAAYNYTVKHEELCSPDVPDFSAGTFAAAQTLGFVSRLGKQQAPSLGRGRGQLALRDCAVRLERSPAFEALLCSVRQEPIQKQSGCTTHAGKESYAENNSFNDIEIEPEKNYACDSDMQVHTPTSPSPEPEESLIAMAQIVGAAGGGQLALRDCSVRLERSPALETLLSSAPQEQPSGRPSCVGLSNRKPGRKSLSKRFFAPQNTVTSQRTTENTHRNPDCPTTSHDTTALQKCYSCWKTFTNPYQLLTHFCNPQESQVYQNYDHLLGKYTSNNHMRKKRNSCDLCELQFECKLTLMIHVAKVHEKVSNIDKTITYKGTVYKADPKPLIRESKLQSKKELGSRNHRKANNQNKEKFPFSCGKCKKGFSSKSSLTTHLFIHKYEKLIIHCCPICQKKCSDKKTLTSHMKSHSVK